MASKSFEKQIEQELLKLTREQKVRFAWLCAMRSLPFLGSNGNFHFWEKEDIQKYLYAIFYALDVSDNSVIYDNLNDNSFINSLKILSSSSFSAFASLVNSLTVSTAIASADAAASNSVYNAAYYTATSVTCYASSAAAATVADNAKSAATAAKVSYHFDFNKDCLKEELNIESIVLSDLKNIQNSNRADQSDQTYFYGLIWDNFQNALEKEECSYWGRLYQTIFENGFELDKKALEQRMSVPPEIQKKGAAEVASYLEALEEQGGEHLNEARIILLGDKGAGKTCLARRLVDTNAPMTTDKDSTSGVDTTLWKLQDENINVHIWDFAGHTVTNAVHQLFLSERCLYVIVYDGRTEERNRLVYWLNHIRNYGGESKAIILVNERDEHSVNIPINSLKEQYQIQGVYTFSIQDDKEKLENFRKEVAGFIQNNPSWNMLEIPAKYFQVKEALEELFVYGKKGNRYEYITKEELSRIAKKKEIADDKIEELLTNLHDLGVSLWYKDMENFDTLVLNPEWISHGVYKIINWANEVKKHALTINDYTSIFKEDKGRYPEDKFKFLFGLMNRYELAYGHL